METTLPNVFSSLLERGKKAAQTAVFLGQRRCQLRMGAVPDGKRCEQSRMARFGK